MERFVDVKVIEESDSKIFEEAVREYLLKGYELKTSSVGFVNSEEYAFCGSYQALMISEWEE